MAMTREQLEAMGGAVHDLHLFTIRNEMSLDIQYALAGLSNEIEREIGRLNIGGFMSKLKIIQNRKEMRDFVNSTPATKQEPENDQ